MAREGIGKDRRNSQQGYNFRGIDDVFNALSPLLSKHGLCILPRCIERTQVERTSAKGGALFYTTVDVEFDFVAAEDGSTHTIRVPGEAMDSADKSTNKAMSAAYKYAAMQAFCIPTEGDNDADATTHEVAARPRHDPVPPAISDDQRNQLSTMLEQSGTDVRRFCEAYGIASLPALPADKFSNAFKRLAATLKAKAKPAAAPAADILDDEVPY
jgi:hypothetical protein